MSAEPETVIKVGDAELPDKFVRAMGCKDGVVVVHELRLPEDRNIERMEKAMQQTVYDIKRTKSVSQRGWKHNQFK